MDARERYAQNGPAQLGEVELVALVLGTGSGGRSALGIAADLLHRFGGLRGLASAEPGRIANEVQGMGPARAVRLHAGLQAGRRSVGARDHGQTIRTPEAAFELLSPALLPLDVEELHALYLDRRLRLVAYRVLTRGSDGLTIVDPRQVFRPAVQLGASHVVMAHNHPSGDPTPSVMDREVTRRVHRAGQVLGVALVDHLVIASGGWRSLAEQLPLANVGPSWGSVHTG
ncbi:MAG: DNA repair protein RadC [Myxococcota bacterium]